MEQIAMPAERTAPQPTAVAWKERCMRYMILESFKGDPVPVYRRFRDQGRMAPAGLRYVDSWVTEDLQRCYQVMECDDPALLQQWMDRWKDIVDFEVIPVVTSSEAAAAIGSRL